VDHATFDTLMQFVGVGVVILPMLALFVGLAVNSRRRDAAERAAELSDLPEAPPAVALAAGGDAVPPS
jgi:hypothetical protein